MAERTKEYEISLYRLPENTISSAGYMLKVPNFFILPEYAGNSFELNSPPFEFANATFCVRCHSSEEQKTNTEMTRDHMRKFYTSILRLNSEEPKQRIFCQIALLNAKDKEYKSFNYGQSYEEGKCIYSYSFNNGNKLYDTRDFLTLIIHLFYINQISINMDTEITSLRDALKNVLLYGQDHNLTFNVKGKIFRAHQDILQARSDVFYSKLNPNTFAKNGDVIDIPDCEPEAFKQFLIYIYTGKVEAIDESNMTGLYYLAKEYNVICLKDECREFIKKSLTVSNVCNVLDLALIHRDHNMLESAINYFFLNMDDVLLTEEWQLFLTSNAKIATELIIKSRKMDSLDSIKENVQDSKITLSEIPRKVISSTAVHLLKVPNFYALPEYNGESFEMYSPSFEFSNSTWCFKFKSFMVKKTNMEHSLTTFYISLVNKFEIPKQQIFYQITLLDGDNKVYDCVNNVIYCDGNDETRPLTFFNNEKPSYDKRDTLTFIIHLFCAETTEADEAQIPFAMDRGFVSLVRDFKNMLLNGQDHNITFNVKNKKFHAHQDILRTSSDVFYSMFNHDMSERNTGVTDVEDCDPQAFEQLLCYNYTRHFEIFEENTIFGLYYAADKYNIDRLKKICCEHIKNSLTVRNVCIALELATTHGDESILDSAKKYFISNVEDILPTQEWIHLMKEYPFVANELIMQERENLKKMLRSLD